VEGFGKVIMIKYLNRREILEINRRMTLEFGGYFSFSNDNIANSGSFEFLLEAPEMSIDGQEIYAGIFEKAAIYCFLIIKDHIFFRWQQANGS
jgi:death-on-curing protein